MTHLRSEKGAHLMHTVFVQMGYSALHVAVDNRREGIVKMLLMKGADPNTRSKVQHSHCVLERLLSSTLFCGVLCSSSCWGQ